MGRREIPQKGPGDFHQEVRGLFFTAATFPFHGGFEEKPPATALVWGAGGLPTAGEPPAAGGCLSAKCTFFTVLATKERQDWTLLTMSENNNHVRVNDP